MTPLLCWRIPRDVLKYGGPMPDVSVVIPTRDRPSLLRLGLFTALQQRRVDLEVIVVDDGSIESIEPLIADVSDERVRVLRLSSPNGVSAARNRGVAASTGAWVAFLDDDDLWAPDKLIRQLDQAAATGRTWVYGGDVNVDVSLRVLTAAPPPTPERVMEALPRFNPVPTGASNVMVRADALAAVGAFDVLLRRTEDWDMWIRLARTGPPACVEDPLVAYRFHPENIPIETNAIIDEPELLAARYGIPIDRAAMQRRAAWAYLRAGRRVRAARHYVRAAAHGDIRSVGRAAAALLHPDVGSERVFRLQRSRRDERRAREAQAWLDELSQRGRHLRSPR
jgi:glycosyltransferase involved in cell wall biosynthesis